MRGVRCAGAAAGQCASPEALLQDCTLQSRPMDAQPNLSPTMMLIRPMLRICVFRTKKSARVQMHPVSLELNEVRVL